MSVRKLLSRALRRLADFAAPPADFAELAFGLTPEQRELRDRLLATCGSNGPWRSVGIDPATDGRRARAIIDLMSKAASGELSPLGKTSSVGSGLPASYDASDAEKLDEFAPRGAEDLVRHAVRKSCKSPAFADYSEKLLFDGSDGALCQALMAARGPDFRIGPELRLIDEFPDLFRDLSIHDIGSLCTMAVMMFRPLKSSVGASGGDSPSSEPENGTAARPRADVLHPPAEARREP